MPGDRKFLASCRAYFPTDVGRATNRALIDTPCVSVLMHPMQLYAALVVASR